LKTSTVRGPGLEPGQVAPLEPKGSGEDESAAKIGAEWRQEPPGNDTIRPERDAASQRHVARREYMRTYQRKWMADRRAEFFAGKACVFCGSTEQLELDHVDRDKKTHHRIWSWSKERREAEVAKCRVLCHECHLKRTAAQLSELYGLNPTIMSKLAENDVHEIREAAAGGERTAALAKRFSVSQSCVQKILNGRAWSGLPKRVKQ
jgi:hypothetical protein